MLLSISWPSAKRQHAAQILVRRVSSAGGWCGSFGTVYFKSNRLPVSAGQSSIETANGLNPIESSETAKAFDRRRGAFDTFLDPPTQFVGQTTDA
jgi:hypothetical protein